jgi:glyoxylase-like metal-dependent hydrolase (beta-lactamase superfamily II)
MDFRAEPYFVPDDWLTADSEPPFRGSRLHLIKSAKPGEALLVLIRDGGILLSGDTLQNWDGADEYFNLPARILLRIAGFLKPCQVGPVWMRYARPSRADLQGLLDLRFEHVLPAHGAPVIGHAKDRFRAAIERAATLAS